MVIFGKQLHNYSQPLWTYTCEGSKCSRYSRCR